MRLAMLAAMRRAPAVLGERAAHVRDGLSQLVHPGGGFRGRSKAADLYYTVFGLESLAALDGAMPVRAASAVGVSPASSSLSSSSVVASFLPTASTRAWLETFGDGRDLDLVHVACLARAWADLDPTALTPDRRAQMLQRLETFRTSDGGFAQDDGAQYGTAYGAFMALGALQDLLADADIAPILASIAALRTEDGGYTNDRDLPIGMTPITAAAVAVHIAAGLPVPAGAADWLKARYDGNGGFPALDGAPWPDLLSTATALHALAQLGCDLSPMRPAALAFVQSLQCPDGTYRGTTDDDQGDCEYTFYALLAMGQLS